MNTIAEFRIPTESFALDETLETLDVNFEAERVTAHDSSQIIPLLWAAGDRESLDRLEEVLVGDSTVSDVELVTDLDNEQLYQMEWVKNVRFIVHMLVEENAVILGASGTSDEWCFRVLFPNREAAADTYAFCQRWDLGVTLQSIYEMTKERHGRFGLTQEQSEALVVAVALGFYDIPRTTHMDELADEIGISRQAVSERLRRAHKKLITSTMAIGYNADARRKGH